MKEKLFYFNIFKREKQWTEPEKKYNIRIWLSEGHEKRITIGNTGKGIGE